MTDTQTPQVPGIPADDTHYPTAHFKTVKGVLYQLWHPLDSASNHPEYRLIPTDDDNTLDPE